MVPIETRSLRRGRVPSVCRTARVRFAAPQRLGLQARGRAGTGVCMRVTRRHAISSLSSAAIGLTVQTTDECLPKGPCPAGRDVAGFTSLCFTDSRSVKHQVYTTGSDGPPVILLHELPGLTRETFATARQLADARYTVVVPLLFGQPGESSTFGNIREVCGREQFDCNEGEKTSPQVAWLRELARCARQRSPDGKGVGVIGMCLTGAFPIPLLREPAVVAPVICQPTLPFNRFNPLQAFGWFMDQSALAVDPEDLKHAREQRTGPLLGIRYKGDRKCQKKRFERLTSEFPNRFYRLDFPGQHHSTLVGDFCPDALLEVLAFFNDHLRTTPGACADRFPRLSQHSQTEVTPDACRGNATHHGADPTPRAETPWPTSKSSPTSCTNPSSPPPRRR